MLRKESLRYRKSIKRTANAQTSRTVGSRVCLLTPFYNFRLYALRLFLLQYNFGKFILCFWKVKLKTPAESYSFEILYLQWFLSQAFLFLMDGLTLSSRLHEYWSINTSEIDPLYDPVTWYKITHDGTQVAQWNFQNKATGTSPAWPAFVLEVPHCNSLPRMRDFALCDRIVYRA